MSGMGRREFVALLGGAAARSDRSRPDMPALTRSAFRNNRVGDLVGGRAYRVWIPHRSHSAAVFMFPMD
jgi:fibrillarin-like rRNA methylase